ncbi:MAG: hypothetical protein ACLS4A_13950 [Oscillospiraceae bacterium]
MKKIVRFAAFTLALAMLPGCGKGRTPAEPTTVNQAMLLEQSAKEQTEYTFRRNSPGTGSVRREDLPSTPMRRWWRSWGRRFPPPP